jgi:hypothetical protein
MNFFWLLELIFISSWIRIRIRNVDPDPGDKSNVDPCGYGSETPHTVPVLVIQHNFPTSDRFAIQANYPTWSRMAMLSRLLSYLG